MADIAGEVVTTRMLDGCMRWSGHSLIVTGPCGDTVEVSPGDRAEVCGYDVMPGTHQRVIEIVPGCYPHPAPGLELTLVNEG